MSPSEWKGLIIVLAVTVAAAFFVIAAAMTQGLD